MSIFWSGSEEITSRSWSLVKIMANLGSPNAHCEGKETRSPVYTDSEREASSENEEGSIIDNEKITSKMVMIRIMSFTLMFFDQMKEVDTTPAFQSFFITYFRVKSNRTTKKTRKKQPPGLGQK